MMGPNDEENIFPIRATRTCCAKTVKFNAFPKLSLFNGRVGVTGLGLARVSYCVQASEIQGLLKKCRTEYVPALRNRGQVSVIASV